jgi:hypothetical protein
MVAKHKEIKVIIESDAHKLEHISTEWLDNAYDIAISYGLKDNLVEDVTLKPLQ